MIRMLWGIFFLLLAQSTFAAKLPLSTFAKSTQYTDVKLSPDGKYLAAKAPLNNQTVLAIIERATLQIKQVYRYVENEHIDEFYWVNNERLVFTRYLKEPWAEQPVSYRQIYAGNFDGSRQDIIFGYQSSKGNSQTLALLNQNRGALRAWGEIVHLLPDDPDHILVSAQHMGDDFDAPRKIYRINVYTHKRRLITKTPLGNMKIIFNAEGKPVAGRGIDVNGVSRQYLYTDGEWVQVTEGHELKNYTPISVSKDGKKLYLTAYINGATEALYQYDFKSEKIEKLYQHPDTDIHRLIRHPETDTVVGVEIMPGKIEYHYIDKNDPFAKLHSDIVDAFGGRDIKITSRSSDLKEMVLLVSSDRNPGDYYLFNTEKNTADILLSRKQWINPAQMAEKTPIQFKARDGQTIHGYLTMPLNADGKVPLVTLVHGGPFGLRDHWNYDTEQQMLANNGYAVLQINFRGSGGYGLDFERTAHQKLSSLIQQDIVDGTKWALSQPEINDNKACIMGWSFGGYSAVMAPLVEPDLFKCSIAAAGVYDVYEQEEEAGYANTRSVAARAAKIYGDTFSVLKQESPLTYIEKLKTPVLIVHGGKDEQAPPEQAMMLRRALQKHHIPYEWMFKEKEGHGFYNEKNREEFYQRVLTFLNQYLKD